MASTISVRNRVALSKMLPRRMPEMTPATIAMVAEITIEMIASRMVTGQACAIMSLILRPVSDVPKSPVEQAFHVVPVLA
jgi:hypothetical protein